MTPMASRRAFLTTVGAGAAGVSLAGTDPVRAQTPDSAPPSAAWSRRYATGHSSRLLTLVPVDDGYVLGGVAGRHDDLRGLAVRTDARGRTRWRRTYGTVKSGVAAGAPHPDGGFVLGGATNLDDSSPFTEPSLSADPWVLRVDAAGDVVWTRTLQPAAATGRIETLVRAGDGYLVGGRRRESRETRPRPWVARLSPAGHRRWATTLGDTEAQGAVNATSADGDAWYVGGSTAPAEGEQAGESETATVTRLDSDGTVQWRYRVDAPKGSRIEGLHADGEGVVCVGNRGFATDDDGQGWHLRLDAAGERAWQRTHSTGPWNWLNGLVSLEDGYLLVGTREETPEGDESNGPRGAWVVRTGPRGRTRWETTYFDDGWSGGNALHPVDGDGSEFLVAGWTEVENGESAWLLNAGGETVDTGSEITHRISNLAAAVPPDADAVGLGVLLGAGAVTLRRRLRGGE
ncbi:hypothetical protein C2R22_02245 [Salinigranum rubrum]|uniref:Uncharacterized protein n=2 Tax=Salinigranum rubrum TaxID=755307 RepID=A0A2I8VFB5_9EURY|nr:hypothetical protein C2R22_02245 [Salinigranum rubrum]